MLRLQTDTTAYVPGAIVAIALLNVSDSHLACNLCAVLERQSTNGWAVVPPTTSTVPCNLVLHPLAPGERIVAHHTLPSGIAPGTYRYRFDLLQGPSGEQLPLGDRVSNAFDVLP